MDIAAQILQYIVSGLTIGGIYSLVAVGFVTIYNVTGILNLAQGEFVMLGAMFAVSFVNLGFPLLIALLLAVACSAAVGAAVERLTVYPARHASTLLLIIITIGVSIALRGIGLIIWGTRSYPLPSFSRNAPISLLGAVVSSQSLWVLGITVGVTMLLFAFFDRTNTGLALKACMINRVAARLMGINPYRMSLLSYVISAGLGGLGGAAIAPITMATYNMGLMLGLKGFVAAILGGLTSPPGAVLGGFILGVLESLGAGLISSGYKDAFAFIVLFVMLFLKPSGLMGISGAKRV